MKFIVTKWTIKKLHDTYKKGDLELSPPYQRNFIWSITDQRYLIDSIGKHNPIPNFFLFQKSDGKFEMVDGQQRSRTILSFVEGGFSNFNNNKFTAADYPNFWQYEFPVTIITDTEGESIERFYAMVNKTGVHVNVPEIRKADYYNTVFLNLINELAGSRKFKTLKVFSDSSLKRMNDTEFIGELVVLIKKGHVDKKNHLDDYFKKDITKDDAAEIKATFNLVLDKINYLNSYYSISKTRYKQRNDFYTLFDFILSYPDIEPDDLIEYYDILILIASDIKPSQEKCIPLQDYARNCVTQSNSKAARAARLNFYKALFLNSNSKPNPTQKQLLTFYNLPLSNTRKVNGFLTIDRTKLENVKSV